MIKNYFKIALRNITRKKVYTTINVLGLSFGICACIVLYLIISYEFSFDSFHPDKKRIYRIIANVTESTGDKLNFAKIPAPVSLEGRSGLSGIDAIAGIIPYNVKISVPDGDKPAKHFESRADESNYLTTVIAEPAYFDIFKYEWLAGNSKTALGYPFTVVLTESKARQYFGAISLDKILGKQVVYQDSLVVSISGIVKDWDRNSDLAFTDFISFATLQKSFLKRSISIDSWKQGDLSAWVFTKLSPGTASSQVNAQLGTLVKMHGDPQTKLTLLLEPLSNIHFNANIIENPIRTAHKPTLYSLIGISLFILLLAIINFINLSTAQSIQRSKEIGVRKVLGSGKAKIVFQFLAETLLLTLLSVLLAVTFVTPVLDLFQSFIPKGVAFRFFESSTFIFLTLVTIITSVFAGLYPARVLSSYLPALNLKGIGAQKNSEGSVLRKGLIVFQFSVSLVFIIGSIVIGNQLKYTSEKDLGFKSEAIITVETPRGEGFGKVAAIAQNIRQIPGVNNVALQWVSPMTDNARGMKLKFKNTDAKDFWVTQVAGNEDFIPVYQIKLLAGRNLVKADSVKEFVINETLSRLMGNKKPEESLGKVLYWNDKPYPVAGVVADFHTSSLHDPITPLCIINRPDRESSLAIRLASTGKPSGMIKTTTADIEKEWRKIYPAATFNYRFYDESLAMLYKKDKQTAVLINTAMFITIFISCMGLFGLCMFIAERRKKEIGIRKVLGASIANIVTMLSKDFIILVMIALLIATPIAWYFMDRWLQDFTYRVKISWWVFIIAGLSAILITLITISFQAIKTAIANPIKSLRTE
ncbi:MAG TPA: ABC transporter permease [Chitinophagaceae bacterium]|nr:ABC transporter permease [Chitinophagaceae bacterium]